MVEFDTLIEMFFDIIEKDKDFFQYNNVSMEDAMQIAQSRARIYLKEALAQLSLQCTPSVCDIDFTDYDDEIGVINCDLSNTVKEMIANVMYERYLFREFSKLKAQANRFTTKDLNVFSPANERNSFVEMYNNIKKQNEIMMDRFLSIYAKGKRITLNYGSIDDD